MKGRKWHASTGNSVSLGNAAPESRGLRARDTEGAVIARWSNGVPPADAREIPEVAVSGNCFGRVAWLGRFSDVTLSETQYASDTVVPSHRHKFPAFFMPLRGSFEIACGPDQFRIGSGRACYYAPEDVHRLRVLSHSASALNVEVRCGSADAFAFSQRRMTRPGSKIPMILMQLHHELRIQDAASMQAVGGLVLQATAELARERKTDSCEPPLWLKQAARFLTDNVSERIDMKQLTAVAGIGARGLFRAFKRFFNRTPAEYLRGQRIAVARQLLEETSDPIARVAGDVGFYDQAHFCHEFKKATGCSPREYRELMGLRESCETYQKPVLFEIQETL
jgi:AraC family transcriptional regulator